MKTFVKTSVFRRFDRLVPDMAYGTRVILAMVSAFILAVLVVAVAVAVSRRHRSGQNLPLPSNTQSFTGDLTYYAPGLGACGITSSAKDSICAVSHMIFDAAANGSNPNANLLCGLKIRVARFNEQAKARRSMDLKVVDRCAACSAKDIDVSPGVFRNLADLDRGRVQVTWAWLPPAPTT